ncbi:MAG: ACT domain-containing protein [Pseudomonadota bacterium]
MSTAETANTSTLATLPGEYMIYRLPPATPVTALPDDRAQQRASLFALARTGDELSLLCPAEWSGEQVATNVATDDLRSEGPWRALRFVGTLDFSLTGVIARLGSVLAQAGISVFVQSTFNTDYVLIRSERMHAALEALRAAGYRIDDR